MPWYFVNYEPPWNLLPEKMPGAQREKRATVGLARPGLSIYIRSLDGAAVAGAAAPAFG
jgi:hypothetical protein